MLMTAMLNRSGSMDDTRRWQITAIGYHCLLRRKAGWIFPFSQKAARLQNSRAAGAMDGIGRVHDGRYRLAGDIALYKM